MAIQMKAIKPTVLYKYFQWLLVLNLGSIVVVKVILWVIKFRTICKSFFLFLFWCKKCVIERVKGKNIFLIGSYM